MTYPNRTTAKATRDTFSPHLWHFSEIPRWAVFFDDRIGADVRTQMVAYLEIPASDQSVKGIDNHQRHCLPLV